MATATALPKREEIDQSLTWNLESIYATDELWETDYRKVEELLPQLQALQGTLAEDGESLLAALELRDQVGTLLDRVRAYAAMRRDENMANSVYQAKAEQVATLGSRFDTATAFFNPEILGINDTDFETYMQQIAPLETYRFHLEDLRRQRQHIRSAEVEAVLAQASEATRSPNSIFNMLNDADMRFPKIRDEHGNEVELTKSRYAIFLESQDRRVRRDAFEGLYGTYAKLRNTLGATLSGSIRRDIFDAKVRGYDSALEAALDPDSIPLAVYDNLISTVNRHLPLLHRYMGLRKKALGLDDLRIYDLYVPITGKPAEYTYSEARKLVEAALAPLGPEYGTAMHRGMYEERWIDVQENEGKRSGAYSWGAYSSQPFVLLNWQDNINNMYTLAHELGHSMHSYYTRKTQPFIYGGYTIFVAEVASTCNEALLTAHLLKTTNDRELRLQILNQQIDEFRGTLFRQTMFAEFERETHRRAEAGEALTTDRFTEIYRELLERYFGSEVVLDDAIGLEWARIPHFYRAFYVYKYATGISAATALSHQILTEGQPAVDRYLSFLKGGGSKTSIELLRGAGVDMTTPEPIEQALHVFSGLLDQYEALLNEKGR